MSLISISVRLFSAAQKGRKNLSEHDGMNIFFSILVGALFHCVVGTSVAATAAAAAVLDASLSARAKS